MATRRGFLQQGLAGTAAGLAGVPKRTAQAAAAEDPTGHLHIGILIFPRMDQIDFTGPFEVLSRVPDSTVHVFAKDKAPLRDVKGLILTPEESLAEVPPLDVLVVPGGPGQEALMEDEEVLAFLRDRAAKAQYVYSVCTGALICGAAGLLKGVRATTHWASFDLLRYFGALPTDERVVLDGKHLSAAGVTAGIDGALKLAALLRGDLAAQAIQLGIEYAPEPPFQSGTPKTAPPEVLEAARSATAPLTKQRLETARRAAARLGVEVKG
ncbi:DJ-1/PfpI family protein [Paludisphaera soli]|uniref:DJ-1/PfpI family protein n=1 Tax=Paludisphaera soli TaxID=2712865 RepID=UPI0013ED3180|nr:DJ-1/PfpI family protein [Paludisphaera soli]